MTWALIISLIVIGLLFILAEILFIPGGILGIVGGGIVGYGVYLSYDQFGSTEGNITLAATSVFIIAGFVYVIRNKTWKKVSLADEIVGKASSDLPDDIVVGLKGKSVSRINPMGKVRFLGELYEVSTMGDFIDEDNEVEIVHIKNNKIVVKLN